MEHNYGACAVAHCPECAKIGLYRNDRGTPKTCMYVLWRNGEPIKATKNDYEADQWPRNHDHFIQVLHPKRRNPQ